MAHARRDRQPRPKAPELYWERTCAISSWPRTVAARESLGTRVMASNQRLFDELLVQARHTLRVNRSDHLT
jgi:hypothetical protein